MTRAITFSMEDHDYLAPLAAGDVTAKGLDLRIARDTVGALDRTLNDPAVHGGELSFSRHIQRLASGDRSFVGIPFFASRAFRHRCFYVRRDDGPRTFADLAGKRVGTNEWRASGNTWSRAILRDAGVKIDGIRWWVGSVDGAVLKRSQGTLPAYVQVAPPDRTLLDMLLRRELDALMCPLPPKSLYMVNSPIVRLVPDYRSAEREYFRRTGIYPLQHIVGVRRQVFDQDPWVAKHIYAALERSKIVWQESRRKLAEMLPWTIAEIEEVTQLMGEDWNPNGVEPTRKIIQAFLDEQVAQDLIPQPLSVDSIFSEFEDAVERAEA
jgi:4,5-dihydroxyphthalate decarboxylase